MESELPVELVSPLPLGSVNMLSWEHVNPKMGLASDIHQNLRKIRKYRKNNPPDIKAIRLVVFPYVK